MPTLPKYLRDVWTYCPECGNALVPKGMTMRVCPITWDRIYWDRDGTQWTYDPTEHVHVVKLSSEERAAERQRHRENKAAAYLAINGHEYED